MEFIVHEMEYQGKEVSSYLKIRHYMDQDYQIYQKIYQEAFYPLRETLHIKPAYYCYDREVLLLNQKHIFILDIDHHIVGAVTIKDHEIDDLIVNQDDRGKDYGQQLLMFAIAYMQKKQHTSDKVACC